MPTLFGPLGNLRTFRGLPPHPVQFPREAAELITIGGLMKVQRAPRTTRRMSWVFDYADPDSIRELIALELGVYGMGPYWWYDPMSARLQMLTPGVASPGLGGDTLFTAVGAAALVYATAAPYTLGVTGSGEAHTPPVPVLAGGEYVAAAEVSASGRVGLRWVDAAEATMSTTYGTAGTGRVWAAGAAPAGAAGVRVVCDPTSAVAEVRFANLQLCEGAAVRTWEPGMGMGRWSIVDGMSMVWQAYRAGSCLDSGFRRQLSVNLVGSG